MYNIIYETSHQSRFDARYWRLGAGALGRPRGMEWGGRSEEGSGWGSKMGEGEGGMIWENGIEIRIISYMERVTSPGSMHDTGCLGLVHWDDPEGCLGNAMGRGA